MLENSLKIFFKGYYWKVKMFNGAVFMFWTHRGDLKRAEAKEKLLEISNGEYPLNDRPYYEEDIEAIWRTRKP